MDTKRAEELIDKFNKGTLSPEEDAILNSWYISLYKDGRVNITDEDLQGRKLAVLGKLDRRYHKRAGIKLWPRIVAVSMAWKIAAAVAAITLGVWLYQPVLNWFQDHPELVSGSPLANDIAPGKNTATLTLADGSVINLSDAKTGVVIDASKLTYSDGTSISSSLRGKRSDDPSSSRELRSKPISQMLTASTPRGGQYQVVLPDGTKVWLNADSKLSFPSQFIGKERKVMMSGEGYFEVAKDKKHPFIVETAGTNGRPGQQVEVLGTHFNINSYADEGSTKTTLLEGSVAVRRDDGQGGEATILKPGQQASLSGSNLQVKAVDPASSIDWKNGEFIFDNEPLESIMRKIMRWYNVEVDYKDIRKTKEFSGTVSRFAAVSETLKMLELTGEVHFKIEGRRIIVMK